MLAEANSSLNCGTSCIARRPGPLKVKSTQLASHIDHFTDKVEVVDFVAHHGAQFLLIMISLRLACDSQQHYTEPPHLKSGKALLFPCSIGLSFYF